VGIATCIIVLKKSKQDNKTLFINASNEFVKSGNKNKLTEANQQRILNAFIERKDDLYFATLVNNTDVASNDYNLSVTSYVEQEDTREIIDITALNGEIAEIVERQNLLRNEIDAIVAELEGDAV
jgi:type I restriction enzyme M protein